MVTAHLILCCCEAPPLLGEVANPMLLMLEYQPQPLTQLPTALKAKTMWNMVMVVFLTRLSLEASGSSLRRLTNKSHISFNSKLKRGLAESHQTIHPAAHPRYWLALY